jgi:hypothetical protein
MMALKTIPSAVVYNDGGKPFIYEGYTTSRITAVPVERVAGAMRAFGGPVRIEKK